MSIREIHIERYLVAEIEARGGQCIKLAVPGRRGWPDRLCILRGGKVYFVEVKKAGGRIAPQQKAVASMLTKLGHAHAFVWDKDGVDDLVREMCNGR